MSTDNGRQTPQGINSERVLTAKLPGKIRVHLETLNPTLGFDEPVYAANWFDTHARWIYDFYNVLALRSVTGVGGAPFFKGRLTELIHGEEADRRDVLLVVRYPSLQNFKSMLQSGYFLLVSFLRIAAVKGFTFGFTVRRDGGPDLMPLNNDNDDVKKYVVFHFKGEASLLDDLSPQLTAIGADLFYAGSVAATISTGTDHELGEKTPCLMQHLAILEAPDDDVLRRAAKTLLDENIQLKTGSSFVGFYDRVM